MEPKQIDELFAQTLAGGYDDELPWVAVRTLHGMGSHEVLDRAAKWCASDTPLQRARGADILAQLGRTADHPGNTFPEECFSQVLTLLQTEKETLPVLAAVHALGHIGNPLALPLVIKHRSHPHPDVRFAVACTLGNFADDARTVSTLLELMQDADEDVRDWATFGLGVQGNFDSEEIRNALCQRMSDPDKDVREEAMVSLARRKDQRVLPLLLDELNQSEISYRVKEAAEALLGQDESAENWTSEDYSLALKNHFSG